MSPVKATNGETSDRDKNVEEGKGKTYLFASLVRRRPLLCTRRELCIDPNQLCHRRHCSPKLLGRCRHYTGSLYRFLHWRTRLRT